MKFVAVITTTPNKSLALLISRTLVEKRLAACAQVSGPIMSTYRWKGKVEKAKEWVCVAKTRAARYKSVEETIEQMHPYDTPEIVAVPLTSGSSKYLRWLAAQT